MITRIARRCCNAAIGAYLAWRNRKNDLPERKVSLLIGPHSVSLQLPFRLFKTDLIR